MKKQGKYRFNEFEVDLAPRTLKRDGRSVSIGLRTFDLLAYFVLNPQRVLGSRELIDILWPDSRAEESDLNKQVFCCASALTSHRSGDKLVMTVPGGGYQFLPQVREVDAETPEAAAPENDKLDKIARTETTGKLEKSAVTTRAVAASNVAVREREPEVREQVEREPEKRTLDEREPTERELVERQQERRARAERTAPIAEEDDFEAPSRRSFGGLARQVPLRILAAVVVVAALAWGAWYAWRSTHRARPESVALIFGDISNNTSEQLFDLYLWTAAKIDLQQSPFLRIADQHDVRDAKRSIRSAAGSRSVSVIRQVCHRVNSQAYVNGEIHRLGQKYLFSLEAFDCGDGSSMARSVGLADSPEDVLRVMDKVAADLRRQLGEPVDSIAKFSKPLFNDRSGSYKAFKALAEARLLGEDGRYADMVPPLSKAIELDPQFTLAYADLGLANAAIGDEELAHSLLTRAYELRESVGEYDRLAIVAAYDNVVTGDLQAAIRNQREGMTLYPRNAAFPANLASLELRVGNAALAIDPAQKAIALNPANAGAYADLAHAQLNLGQFDEAQKTCQKAIDKHLDGAEVHGYLLQIAYLLQDQPAMDEQIAWGKRQAPDSAEANSILEQQALIALADGKVKAAHATLVALADGYRKRGEFGPAERLIDGLPRTEAELGMLVSAQNLLSRLPEANGANGSPSQSVSPAASGSVGAADLAVAWAELGERSRAEAMLKRELDAHPLGTLWQAFAGPQVRASIQLNQGQADAAIQALQSAVPFDLLSFDLPAMRGRAYLAGKQPELAEGEFHKILDHSGIEPLSYNFPLARLGLARALVAQGKLADAEQAYKIVFNIWKDADPDLPRLVAARQEYAKITGSSAAPKPKPTTAGFGPGSAKVKPFAAHR